jgi:acetyltransferase-like isoleucine patch superfamily enzyme
MAFGVGSRLFPPATVFSAGRIGVGARVTIREQSWLNANGEEGDDRVSLTIGDGTSIGRFVHINASSSVVIGRGVLIADRVYISDADHNFGDTGVPIIEQGVKFRGAVVIGENSWIGVGAAILPGVRVGRGAIVGANSVVTRDVPEMAIVAGSPAKVIKFRTDECKD